MAFLSGIRRWWQSVLDIGSFPGESDVRRGRRRILVGYLVIGTGTRLVASAAEFSEGSVEGWVDLIAAVFSLVLLGLLWLRPSWYLGVANLALLGVLVETLTATVLTGGIVPSSLIILFGMLTVVGALILLTVRAAVWWFAAYVATLALGVVLPEYIDPVEVGNWSTADIAFTIVGVTFFIFLGMAYFVRQRDRFQQESDDLLHNILPVEIATRLKANPGMIADDYQETSVLFADVVDFTPMSADMSPPELVGLLNDLFSAFDGFVDELGLEKIKTVGDEYMVAAGVPEPRPDHAHAIAELALLIRDYLTDREFDGHTITMRIGINSGPVVAGIVGTHKFAYDLWGDVVNTASRMESSGMPGAIQITPATYALVDDAFVCEPRGAVSVKGKGEMTTFLLVGRRADAATT